MVTIFTSAICIVQIALLVALMVRDVCARRRRIADTLSHRGWVMSARGLPPMQREPLFARDTGAIVYLLPERYPTISSASLQNAA